MKWNPACKVITFTKIRIWAAIIGDLLCEREPFNVVDKYAVAVLKDDTIVGHILKKISRIVLCL